MERLLADLSELSLSVLVVGDAAGRRGQPVHGEEVVEVGGRVGNNGGGDGAARDAGDVQRLLEYADVMQSAQEAGSDYRSAEAAAVQGDAEVRVCHLCSSKVL